VLKVPLNPKQSVNQFCELFLKARARRRYVLGLREVTKHLKMHKLKCVIISPNLERVQSKGRIVFRPHTLFAISTVHFATEALDHWFVWPSKNRVS